MASRRHSSGPRERLEASDVYVLGGRFVCGLCDRKMQGHWANDSAYHRCRFPAEYAIANKLSHPLNVFVRECEVLPELDAWVATEFPPRRIEVTIDQMTAATGHCGTEEVVIAELRRSIRGCDTKIARYRNAIDAGGDIEEIAQWINRPRRSAFKQKP
jgi:site-specific DNA recombinase